MKQSFEFWLIFNEALEMLSKPLGPDDGETDERLNNTEVTLGVRFPKLLREYYAYTALREDINKANQRLISLDNLFIDQDHLVFYEENQYVTYYGIRVADLSLDDPPVMQGLNHNTGIKWPSDAWTDSLGRFFLYVYLDQQYQCKLKKIRHYSSPPPMEIVPDGYRYFHWSENNVHIYWQSNRLLILQYSAQWPDVNKRWRAIAQGTETSDLNAIADAFALLPE